MFFQESELMYIAMVGAVIAIIQVNWGMPIPPKVIALFNWNGS